jgi:TonB family protein
VLRSPLFLSLTIHVLALGTALTLLQPKMALVGSGTGRVSIQLSEEAADALFLDAIPEDSPAGDEELRRNAPVLPEEIHERLEPFFEGDSEVPLDLPIVERVLQQGVPERDLPNASEGLPTFLDASTLLSASRRPVRRRAAPAPAAPPLPASAQGPAPAPRVARVGAARVAAAASSPRSPAAGPARRGLRVLYAPDPRRYYPLDMLRRGIEGSVDVGFVVNAQGLVERTWVEATSGVDALDRAALALVRAYQFEALGSPRRSRIPILFRVATRPERVATYRRTR